MKRIITFVILLTLCTDCLAQDPVQVVRTYISTLNDALSSPDDMTRRKKIENLLGSGSPGITDEIVERYNTTSTSRMQAGQYLAIFYYAIQNSDSAWIKVSIIGMPTVKEDRGVHKVYATLQYSGAITLKTSSEFLVDSDKIIGIMFDYIGIAKIASSGGKNVPPSQDVTAVPVQQQSVSSGSHNYVDLGLPSGTLWATCNVGATNPWDFGNYFAWGETKPKSTYSWSNYKYANGASDKLTKYCNSSSYGNKGFTDSRTTLEKTDDAATINWGIDWCMPSQHQFQELYDNCTIEWTTNYQGKGVAGSIFKSKKNGKSIFFPATGWKDKDGKISHIGSYGYYWSSSLKTGTPFDACNLSTNSSVVYANWSHNRCNGLSIRPVRCSN